MSTCIQGPRMDVCIPIAFNGMIYYDRITKSLDTYDSRFAKLMRALKEEGVPYRLDSSLCRSYLNDELNPDEWDVEKVAQECALMHYLYNYTDYSQRLAEFKKIAHTFRSENMTHDQYHVALHTTIFPKLKRDCIQDHGGIPDKWPWFLKK